MIKKYNEEESFSRRRICGFCDGLSKEIVLCDMSTYAGWEYEIEPAISMQQNFTLRHEIVHAFLNESGLGCNTLDNAETGWARNEEMVDWIASQGQKIYNVWKELDAL